jgi:hypothetical protein
MKDRIERAMIEPEYTLTLLFNFERDLISMLAARFKDSEYKRFIAIPGKIRNAEFIFIFRFIQKVEFLFGQDTSIDYRSVKVSPGLLYI